MLTYALGAEREEDIPILAPPPGSAYTQLSDLSAFYQNEIALLDNSDIAADASVYIMQTLAMELDDFRFMMQVKIDGDHISFPQAPFWKWEKVYRILDRAEQQKRRLTGAPHPEQILLNGVQAADEASSVISSGVDEQYPRWKTFGGRHAHANLGFILSSGMLQLVAGIREITWDIYLDPALLTPAIRTQIADVLVNGFPFSVELWEKDWMPFQPSNVSFVMVAPSTVENVIRITLNLSPDADPIVAPSC